MGTKIIYHKAFRQYLIDGVPLYPLWGPKKDAKTFDEASAEEFKLIFERLSPNRLEIHDVPKNDPK